MTGNYRSSSFYAMGIGIETTPGTYMAPSVFLPYANGDPDLGITDSPFQGHIGYRDSNYMTTRDKVDPKFDLKMPAWPENGLEHLLYLLLGSKVSTELGSGPAYSHVMNQANVLPTCSITKWANISGQVEPQAWEGCMVNEMKIDMPQPGLINLDVNFLTRELDLSQTQPTQTFSGAIPFQFGQCAMQLGTVATPGTLAPFSSPTKFSLDIKNNVSAEHMMDGTLSPNLIVPGPFDVSGHIEFPYADWTELKGYLSGSSTGTSATTTILDRALSITATGANIASTYNYLWSLNLPKLNMKALKINDSDKAAIKYAFDFQGKFNGLTSNTISSTVQSKLVSIV